MHFLQSDSRRFADLCLKKKCYSPLRFWELTECKPELNRIVAVQECDARMFNKIAITGYIKNKFCTAGFFDSLFRNFNSKTIAMTTRRSFIQQSSSAAAALLMPKTNWLASKQLIGLQLY